MAKRLIDYLGSCDDEAVARLLLQDMAICQAWYESQSDSPSIAEQHRFIPDRILFWQDHFLPADEKTEGRRHQLVLRALIDALGKDQHQTIHPDEVQFLCSAWELILKVSTPDRFSRVKQLLEPHMQTLLQRRQSEHPLQGLPILSKRIQYVTEDDIRHAPPRETRLLAGIELPCRGPVMTCPTHLRVLGDVPDNCTVVVENDGHCCVDGYLLGRVLCKQQCEVSGNIAGVAVVLHGDIRARSIINNAHVVAKMGSVFCFNAQGPKLVFAGREICIQEGTMLGCFITRIMHVEKEIRGGQIQVSDLIQADYFRHLGANPLAIVLRRELTPEDFGEITGAQLNKLLSQAYRLRRSARNYDAMAGSARREAEHTAQSVVMFLLGGSEVHKKLEDIVSIQHRLDTICRIIDNLEGALSKARDVMSGGLLDKGADEPGLDPFDNKKSIDQDLLRISEDALQLQKRLNTTRMDKYQTTMLMQQISEKLEDLYKEREKYASQIEQKNREIFSSDQFAKLLADGAKSSTKLEMLEKMLPAIEKQPPNSSLGARFKTSFVSMAMRNIERKIKHAEEHEEKAEENRKNFRAVSERLGKDFQIRVLENPEDEDSAARATGQFEPGVKIYMELFSENDNDLPPGSVLVTKEDKGHKTYIRANTGARFYAR